MWLRSLSACGRSSCRSSCDASGSGGGSSCCCAHTRHGRSNFKYTNPLMSYLLVIFVWGGGSNFVGSESGQKQSVKLLQNMVYSTIQHPPTPPSDTHCLYKLYSVYRQCEAVRGGPGVVELYCRPYSAGVLHSGSDQIKNLQNCFTTPNKMTSKDDIKGLVSLKFLRPWCIGSLRRTVPYQWQTACRAVHLMDGETEQQLGTMTDRQDIWTRPTLLCQRGRGGTGHVHCTVEGV